ncbi:hypothetical protein ACRALDRAFT_1093492, partial [Sodiomyces alcalophilus JCM 7366]|uniref:uncharacterized protein n=1 Tax=Sodiomyces alcalophilus JCM 7366 TaxID=591952 RepID=UPI0039B48212
MFTPNKETQARQQAAAIGTLAGSNRMKTGRVGEWRGFETPTQLQVPFLDIKSWKLCLDQTSDTTRDATFSEDSVLSSSCVTDDGTLQYLLGCEIWSGPTCHPTPAPSSSYSLATTIINTTPPHT